MDLTVASGAQAEPGRTRAGRSASVSAATEVAVDEGSDAHHEHGGG